MIVLDNQIPHNCSTGDHKKIVIIHSSINKSPGDNRVNYFSHLIHREDRLDLISLLRDILIASPEWDEHSRGKTFPFPSLVKNNLP
jgi:hypothetical protein